MKTAIQKAIEDINGYRSFDDKIDIRFVCVLLNSYLEDEMKQIKLSFFDGEQNIKEESVLFKNSDDYFIKKYSYDKNKS